MLCTSTDGARSVCTLNVYCVLETSEFNVFISFRSKLVLLSRCLSVWTVCIVVISKESFDYDLDRDALEISF